jgi:capsular polysaccharide transport system ATP-binding protein
MITFDNVSKCYPVKGGRRTILKPFTGVFETGARIGIVGRNGAGKSTLMRLLSGAEKPDTGHITRYGRVSWPLGFSGGLHRALTGRENIRFVSRIYGVPFKEVYPAVENFADLGSYMDEQIRVYSSGMRARLAFGISMALEFDCYLIDEVIAVGDAKFKRRCAEMFDERQKYASLILVSHSDNLLKQFCDIGGVLHNGHLQFYQDLDETLRVYQEIIEQ